MRRFKSINDSKVFAFMYKNSPKWFCNGVIIYYQKSDDKGFAVVSSKKIGCAVVRNRARRLIKSAFVGFCDDVSDGNYIFIAKKEIFEIPFYMLEKNLKWGLRKLGCLK